MIGLDPARAFGRGWPCVGFGLGSAWDEISID